MKHRKEKAKGEERGKNFEIQVVSGPIVRSSFWVLYLRWRVQNLLFPGPQHMMTLGNQLKAVLKCNNGPKLAVKVAKKSDNLETKKSLQHKFT